MAEAKDYSGVSLGGCVEALITNANATYAVKLIVNQGKRSPEQAQKFHVCHMFLYNKFKHLKPKHTEPGARTIAWAHLSDAKVNWTLIGDVGEFLKTAQGTPAKSAVVNGDRAWIAGSEPDRATSTKAMALFLKSHHVASMAAPGVKHCAPPCACGGSASKHLTGDACDLGGMSELEKRIRVDSKGQLTLDRYLAGFSLYRPMAHYTDSRREEWHVEKKNAGHPSAIHGVASPHHGEGHLPAKHSGKSGLVSPGLGARDPVTQTAIIRHEQMRNAKLA